MEKYEFVRDIGSGSFGVAKLMRNKETRELVAVKFIERGSKINDNVVQEITNHRSLRHPNVVRFKEVVLSSTHLGIVMEYAAGGELSERVFNAGRFSEDEARYFFQQLISGVNYCHSMKVSHRDLKLENTLLDGSPAPRVKICDFGYSMSSVHHSTRESAVGTPAYMAPEVLARGEYDGKLADVWSCGVTLYVMLIGEYPFNDNVEPKNSRKTLQRILGAEYKIPEYVDISSDCRHLLSRIFVALPTKRIAIEEIKHHVWFLKNLPRELTETYQVRYYGEKNSTFPLQSMDEIMIILREAMRPTLDTLPVSRFIGGGGPEEEKDDGPMICDVRLPERSIVPNQLQSRYLNSSAFQLRWAPSSSIEVFDSAQAASTFYPMMSDVRLAERSIIDPNSLHSWYLNASDSQLKFATSSIVDSEILETNTLIDISMSDVRPAERSVTIDLDYSDSRHMNQ